MTSSANISDLERGDLKKKIISEGVRLQIGPFVINVRSSIPAVYHGIKTLYADYPAEENSCFADFHIQLSPPANLRRWIHPQVFFYLDSHRPFKPLPLSQAFPFFEWGLNWCIARNIHQFLIIHAAVLSKEGKALIMPSPPEAGKSTLCAGLVSRGWRLLSDELTMVSPETGLVTPVPRPISLKNESIEVIRTFAPGVTIGPSHHDTSKGTVAHMKPPVESIKNAGEKAAPAWLVIPRYQREASTRLEPRSKGLTMMHVIENSFNYSILGRTGFETAAELIDCCRCLDFTYSDLHEAVEIFDSL